MHANASDSVNMYASTWICTKEAGLDGEESKASARKASLAELRLEGPAIRME
jgi:betaine lipid synthase